ncbi:uncharacterized protein A4U43_C09F7740 [Asparagus officinalis]|uniref:Uncharacterized protein n=1 Tax=Asparagus officinalis TaxID=4686 RepID=A0A5P1E5Z7_ASPOF|nr:uncharacterized protein A4U43_C09F7740 [Asparagus officinalis]
MRRPPPPRPTPPHLPLFTPSTLLRVIREITQVVGSTGMAAGQLLDLEEEAAREDNAIHQAKEGEKESNSAPIAKWEPTIEGYLRFLVDSKSLSDSQAGFFMLIKVYFPTIYDIKHLMMFCNSLHGGLNKLAELLDVERVGICHQAGSDSLLTSCTIRKLKESFFNGNTEKYASVLYSLGVENGQNTH